MRRLVFLIVLGATLAPAAIASAETAAEKRVAQQIGIHLKQSGELRNYRVGVKYHDGVAYLNGSVTSAEQRDAAVRLAKQCEGVSHVVCKLECPSIEDASIAKTESDASGDRPELTQELNKASFEGAQSDSTGVMQAFQGPEDQAPQMQQNQMQQNQFQQNQFQQNQFQQNAMMQRQAARPMAAQGRRTNMPVPAHMLPGVMPMQQGGPSGVCQASGSCPCNSGGGMGPGMGGGGMGMGGGGMGGPAPSGFVPQGSGRGPGYDNPQMPGYAWPSYASYPNYAAVTYPQQYSPTAWPYIGPFYPYPQVPLAWRKVSLEWDDGWWFLDFSAHNSSH